MGSRLRIFAILVRPQSFAIFGFLLGSAAALPDPKDLSDLLAHCRMHPEVLTVLARLISDIIARRKRIYHDLAARGSSHYPPPTRDGRRGYPVQCKFQTLFSREVLDIRVFSSIESC